MLSTAEYDYQLPGELIAQRPAARRDAARLMVLRRSDGTIAHHRFSDLPQLLSPEDCLVLNDSRVVPARLEGRRAKTGGRWTGLFLERRDDGRWEILSRTRGKLQTDERIELEPPAERRSGGRPDHLELRLVARTDQATWIAEPQISATWIEALNRYGRVPLPPYIRQGRAAPGDRDRYQTVYARRPGSVAAPTAGLHFTEPVLAVAERRGIAVTAVTLHVGWGTFRPIASPTIEGHTMHAEHGELSAESADLINRRRGAGGRIVAVGSTSLRLIETAALASGGTTNGPLAPLSAWSGETGLYIYPPYSFRIVDGLVTNFHLPRTSLLVLVSALAGRELVRRAYEEAIRLRYRFYSYGDAMLIL
jgi:S-adenosylmethionine:tRNA ribosyltransferase-isomerase